MLDIYTSPGFGRHISSRWSANMQFIVLCADIQSARACLSAFQHNLGVLVHARADIVWLRVCVYAMLQQKHAKYTYIYNTHTAHSICASMRRVICIVQTA